MEFSPDVAILHSAFQLAEKTCPGGLCNFSKDSPCTKTLNILQEALCEIAWPCYQKSEKTSASRHWPLRILALFVSSLLSGKRDVHVAGVTLPGINWALFFELAKLCAWKEQLIQLFDCLNVELTIRLLKELVQYARDTPTDENDTSLGTSITIHLLSHDNDVLWQSDQTSEQQTDSKPPIADMLQFLEVNRGTILSQKVLAILNLYQSVIRHEGLVETAFKACIARRPAFDVSQDIIRTAKSILTRLAVELDESLAVSSEWSAWEMSVLTATFDWFSSDGYKSLADTKRLDSESHLKLMTWIQPIVERNQSENSFPDELAKVVYCIAERLAGYEEMCDWIANVTETEIILDKRWILCLEENMILFSSRSYFLSLCHRLSQLVSLDHDSTAQQLRLVLLAIFNSLPVTLYDSILQEVYSIDVLSGVDKDFQADLLSTFNRLVNLTEDFPEMYRRVAVLALQSPYEVLTKLIFDALTHSGQVVLLAKLLREMPSVAQKLTRQGVSCLCKIICDITLSQTLKSEEHRNLNMFISTLLKPSASMLHVDSVIRRKAAISATEFLNYNVLGQLHYKVSSTSSNALYTALLLLKIVVETLHSDWRQLVDCRLLPIAVCVCSVIDSCHRHSSISEDRPVIKQAAVDALTVLVGALEEHHKHLEDGALSWLREQLRCFHWTTTWHLMSRSNHLKILMALPSTICTLLQDVDGECWAVIEVETDDLPLFLLLELCSTNEYSLQFAMTHFCREALLQQPAAYTSLIAVLVQMLPHVLGTELERIFDFVHFLVVDAILPVIMEQMMIKEPQTPFSTELCFSHLLRDILQVTAVHMKPTACLQRVCQQYVAALQRFCMASMLTAMDTRGLQAVLADICLCAQSLPPQYTDQLLVPALQIVAAYKTSSGPRDELCSTLHLLENNSARSMLLHALQQEPVT